MSIKVVVDAMLNLYLRLIHFAIIIFLPRMGT